MSLATEGLIANVLEMMDESLDELTFSELRQVVKDLKPALNSWLQDAEAYKADAEEEGASDGE